MATITIRIDNPTRDALEAVAGNRGVPLSMLLREQIDILLGRTSDLQMKRPDVPASLSMVNRLQLAQQHEILARLTEEDEDGFHGRMVEALRRGYTSEYEDAFAGIEPEMPRSECQLLWDILDMFVVLKGSLMFLGDADRAALDDDVSWLRFAGFDFQDSRESRLSSYLDYLLAEDRWTDLKPDIVAVGDGGNSHSRRLPRYERQLATFSPMWRDRLENYAGRDMLHLDASQLRAVAAAAHRR